MKKSKATARPIGRVGRNPVIAVRVPAPLHQRIVESAKTSGRSMSEEMAALLAHGFEWQDAFGDRMKMLDAAKVEIGRMVSGNLEAELRRQGWRPLHGSPYWMPPGVAPQEGFTGPETAPQDDFVDVEAKAADELDEIDAVIEAVQIRLNKLKASRKGG